MMAVGLSADQVIPYLRQSEIESQHDRVVVACINSPKSVTMSGDHIQMDILKSLLDKDSVFARKLRVNVAYHSPQMQSVAKEYLTSLNHLEPGDYGVPGTVMISSVTANPIPLVEIQQSEYWVRNLVCPVRFSEALTQMCAVTRQNLSVATSHNLSMSSVTDLLEVGPHATLRGPIQDTLEVLGADVSYTSALLRSALSTEALINAVGRLHCFGHTVDISTVNQLQGSGKVVLTNLPAYPFNHSRSFWYESRISKHGMRLRKFPRLDLLGCPVSDWNPLEAKWRNYIRASEMPWIKDHVVCRHTFTSLCNMHLT